MSVARCFALHCVRDMPYMHVVLSINAFFLIAFLGSFAKSILQKRAFFLHKSENYANQELAF